MPKNKKINKNKVKENNKNNNNNDQNKQKFARISYLLVDR